MSNPTHNHKDVTSLALRNQSVRANMNPQAATSNYKKEFPVQPPQPPQPLDLTQATLKCRADIPIIVTPVTLRCKVDTQMKTVKKIHQAPILRCKVVTKMKKAHVKKDPPVPILNYKPDTQMKRALARKDHLTAQTLKCRAVIAKKAVKRSSLIALTVSSTTTEIV